MSASQERLDHFFNSPEADGVSQYSEEVVIAAAQAFINRTGITLTAEELAHDYLRRV